MSKNDVSMAYRIDELPRGVPKAEFYKTLIECVRDQKPLPKGWVVTWEWRNTQKQSMREAPIITAVRKSRAGFVALQIRRLTRDAERLVPGFVAPEIREATEDEIEEFFEEYEDYEDEVAERKEGQGTRKAAISQKRRAAALRGWETRRRNAAKKKRNR